VRLAHEGVAEHSDPDRSGFGGFRDTWARADAGGLGLVHLQASLTFPPSRNTGAPAGFGRAIAPAASPAELDEFRPYEHADLLSEGMLALPTFPRKLARFGVIALFGSA
jgi:hypothetical protein